MLLTCISSFSLHNLFQHNLIIIIIIIMIIIIVHVQYNNLLTGDQVAVKFINYHHRHHDGIFGSWVSYSSAGNTVWGF